MSNYKIGKLGYNPANKRFGLLICDLWEIEGFHCGDCFDVWSYSKEVWIPVRIEKHYVKPSFYKEDCKSWYLVDTKLQGEDLEGLRIRVTSY